MSKFASAMGTLATCIGRQRTGQRHDPCLLDTFIAAARYMAGEPKRPWWKYTAERKRELAARGSVKE